jgi:hypothetical protein
MVKTMKLCTCIALSLAMLRTGAFAHEQTDIHTTTYATANGSLTVSWDQPAGKHYGPPPPFA